VRSRYSFALPELARTALGSGGALSQALPGHESRPGQIEMAARVAEAIEGDERLLCEAGTGTGKTLAYLVPAVLSGRKVVIATGTKTLQDQIARVDLPRLSHALDEPFSFAVMKGLSNYICLRRFNEQLRQNTLPLHDGPSDPTTGDSTRLTQRHSDLIRLSTFIQRGGSGDRAELDEIADDAPLWRDVTASPETRLGSRCAYNEACFVTKMRQEAADAQVILTNHHLFFADLALRSQWPDAQVLPPYDVIIFDEAHQIEDVATEFFGEQVSSQRLLALARDISRAPLPATAVARAQDIARRVQLLCEDLVDVLRRSLPRPRNGLSEVRVPLAPELFHHAAANTAMARSTNDAAMEDGVVDETAYELYLALDTALDEAASFFQRGSEQGELEADGSRGPAPPKEIAGPLSGLARRCTAVRDAFAAIVDSKQGKDIRWVTASVRNLSLRTSPVDVSPRLARCFDNHMGPIIFTSATLSVANDFEYIRQRLGVGDTASEATFPSPFVFSQQALVYLPADLPDPTDRDYTPAFAERALDLCRLSRGRALVLFTSFRALNAARKMFEADGTFPLLVQGSKPKHTLLAELRSRVGSVLLATQSFWEGVDVPGQALSLVVIDRIPFAVPDEPLVAARISRLREAGEDPFTDFQLPQAALALRQGFGRLIRTRADTGVVAICDGRITRRSYGRMLLAALPPECVRTEELGEVAAFFEAEQGPARSCEP